MRRYIIFLIFILTFTQAQEKFQLKGVVVDSLSSKPIENANVFIKDLQRGTTTSSVGEFIIDKIESGSYYISIQLLGYKTVSKKIEVKNNLFLKYSLEEQDIHLGEMHVVGEKYNSELLGIGQSVTTMSLKEIEMLRGQTVSTILEGIPGITLYSTGPSISKPVIRGFHSQRIVVINAGVPIEGQQWGNEHAPEIDPFSPTKVDVIKGASSVEYGNGALGGVIKFDPRNFRNEPGINGTVIGNLFSNNRQLSGSMILDGAFENLPLSWQTQISGRYAGDSQTPEYYITNSGFREVNGSFGIKYGSEDHFVETYFSHFGNELGIYSGSHIGSYDDMLRAIERGKPEINNPFSYEIKDPSQKVNHDLLSFHAVSSELIPGIIDFTYGWQKNKRQEFDGHLKSRVIASMDMTLTTYNVELKYKHLPFGLINGVAGISGNRQGNINEGKSFLVPNHRSYTSSIFLIEQWKSENLGVSIGSRYSKEWRDLYFSKNSNLKPTTIDYETLNGMISLEYLTSEQIQIGATLSSASRAPSANELYSDGVHHGSAQYEIGNSKLHPEKSIAGDLTTHMNFEEFHGELNIFHNRISNYIYLFPRENPTVTITGVFPTFEYRQSDVTIQGFDGSLQYELSEKISIKGNVGIVIGNISNSGELLYGMPGNRFRISPHFHIADFFKLKDVSADLNINHVQKQKTKTSADYLPPPNSYTTIDLFFSGRIETNSSQIKIQLGVNNLLNTKYREHLNRFRYFIDNTGRDISLKFLFTF